MIKKIFCIRDKLAAFGEPFFDINEKTAIRGFRYAMSNGDSLSPSDFDLFCIGEYDFDTGRVTPCEPTFVCGGLSDV